MKLTILPVVFPKVVKNTFFMLRNGQNLLKRGYFARNYHSITVYLAWITIVGSVERCVELIYLKN